jgi:hypothetical protein
METVNRRLIKLIRKGSTKDIITRILEDCCENGIRVTLNCMIGFPTETEEEARETVEFINSLNSIYPDLVFKCNTGFVFVPRLAPFGQTPEKFGITVVEEFEWSPRLEWVPPDWRYQERYQQLEGRIFERTYKSAKEVQEEVQEEVRAKGETLGYDSVVRLSDNLYIHRTRCDVIEMWKKCFAYDGMVQAKQRESRRRKDEIVPSVDALISAQSRQAGPENQLMTFAYVVGADYRRRIVPLSPVYELLLGLVVGETPVADIKAKMAGLYAGLSAAEIDRSVLFGLNYLLKNEILRLSDQATNIKGRATRSADRYYARNNFGSNTVSSGSSQEGGD